jgi:uncharacterized protein YkwD
MTRLTAIVIVLAALAAAAPSLAAAEAGPARLIAPAAICPHQAEPNASVAVQQRAMRCLTDFARQAYGLEAFEPAAQLNRAATHKAADILSCDEFSHEACGHEFTYWMQRFGYLGDGCWQAAENIAWGTGTHATVRWIFGAWMRSAGHRENILGPYAEIGIGLHVGSLESNSGAHVWTEEFGNHDC